MAIPQEIQQTMYGFMISQVLFTGDEIGIFDSLCELKSLTELAQSLELSPDALERFILAGIAIGFIEKQDNNYCLAEHLRPFLKKSSPDYCGNAFSHFREVSTKTFLDLKIALKENQPQWQQIFSNTEAYSPFEQLYSDPQRTENFLSSMWGMGYAPARELVEKFSLEGYQTLVDLGGGSGSFAIAALSSYPTLKGIIFDIESVYSYLRQKIIEHKLQERLDFIAGDFFTDKLPSGDIYSLGYILSDWNRKDGTNLLKKIYHCLPEGGCILILEKLFNEEKNGPVETAMMNLAMLLETRGKHYSGSEYINWLKSVGFKDCKVIYSSGEKHMVVGIKGSIPDI